MADPAVLYDVQNNVATITLNRPENRNSMTKEVLEGFIDSVKTASEDESLRCVVITGSGKSFCAGADFKERGRWDHDDPPALANERSFRMYQPFLSVLNIQVPVIAAMNGHAIGGGMGLALVCDIRVASEDSKYGSNFTKLGLHPGMATTYLLPRIVGMPKAAELLFTGRIITGAEACELGLVNHAVPAAEVLAKAQEIATEVASCAPVANRWTKHLLYQHANWDPTEAARREAELQSRTLLMEDHAEGVAALLEKRAPKFTGK